MIDAKSFLFPSRRISRMYQWAAKALAERSIAIMISFSKAAVVVVLEQILLPLRWPRIQIISVLVVEDI